MSRREPVSFGWEKLARLLDEPNAMDMIRDQHAETGSHHADAPLDIDWAEKMRMEEAGRYRVWAARSGDTLAGFIAWHIIPHLNHRSTLFAITDVHCLAPAFRDKDRLGLRMWRSCEPALRDLGVKIVMPHDDIERSLLPFFLALGYRPMMTIFSKVLR